MPLTNAQREHFRRLLDAHRVELIRRSRRGVAIEHGPGDDVDRAQAEAHRERAAVEAEGDTRLLREIRTRLFEISTGHYGVCVECDGTIPVKRLEAVPWTNRCVRCASAAEEAAKAPRLAAPTLELAAAL